MLSAIWAVLVILFPLLTSFEEIFSDVVALVKTPANRGTLDNIPFLYRQLERHDVNSFDRFDLKVYSHTYT